MKLPHPFKSLLLALVLIMAAPLSAKAESTPSDAGNDLTHSAANLATKTVNLIKDSAITGDIYAKLALDTNLSRLSINVSTDKGKVTLTGVVNSDTEAKSATQLAYATSGVTAVDASKLVVKKSNQPFTDTSITAKLKATFAYKHLFDSDSIPSDIRVETQNGVVYLSGKANNPMQIQNAINLAKSISGVSHVESFIQAKNSQ